jgi:hypothetical protein
MTEGGIAQWKKKEGESYSAGDVLLEIVRFYTFIVSLAADPAHHVSRKPTRPLST